MFERKILSEDDIRVSVFIVGATKSGTTALYHYLSQSPDLYFAETKELQYFCRDIRERNPVNRVRDFQHYHDLFSDACENQIKVDASPQYLFSKSSAAEIADYNPEAKIIAILRNPVDMVYSLHSQLLHVGIEKEENFEKAIRRSMSLYREQPLSETDTVDKLRYIERALYSEQIQRFLSVFPTESVRVYLYDDLKKDTGSLLEDVFGYLDVAALDSIDTQVVNANKKVKNRLVHKLYMERPGGLGKLWRSLPSGPKQAVKRFLMNRNTENSTREPMESGLRAELSGIFESDIAALEKLIGRSLGDWRAAAE